MGPYVLPRSLPIVPALLFRRHSHLLTRPMVATNPHARPDPSDGGGQSGVRAGRLPSQVHSSLGPKAAPRPLCFVLSRPPVFAHDRLCLHATVALTVAGAGTKGQLGLSLADAPSALRGAFTHRLDHVPRLHSGALVCLPGPATSVSPRHRSFNSGHSYTGRDQKHPQNQKGTELCPAS